MIETAQDYVNAQAFTKPAAQARELKQLGFVRSNADLVSQAVNVLYQQVIDQRLKTFRLKALERVEEENGS